MKKVLITAFLLLVLVALPTVSAETEISVKTLKFHQVNVFVLQSGEVYKLLEEFHVESDKFGRVNVVSKVNDPTIDLLVNIKWNGNQVASQKFEDLSTTEKIEVILPESAKEIPDEKPSVENNETNSTEQNLTEETEVTEEENAQIEEVTTEEEPSAEPTTTGKTVLNNETNFTPPKIFWFVVIGLIVVIVGLLLMKKMFSGNVSPPQQFGAGNTPEDFDRKRTEEEIEKAERSIREAQVEINKIKNEGKIKEAQKKIEDDRRRLEKLKRGEEE